MDRAKKEAMIREARKPKAPKDIQVESKNTRVRVILLICSVVVAIVALAIGFSEAFSTEPGWHTVESGSQTYHCGGEFAMNYHFGASGEDPTDEEKAVKQLYTQATEDAYRIFYREGQLSQIQPGKPVKVDPALYAALAQIQSYQNRSIYLAPAYVEYDRIFLATDPQEAAQYDPVQDLEVAAYIAEIARFANDPAMVDVRLLEDSTVELVVAKEYADFARDNAIDCFLDLGWMRNAFIADFIAKRLQDAGHTHGYLASYDGYTRNLDTSNLVYSLNLFDRLDNSLDIPAIMDYQGAMSIVFWRNYPLSSNDRWHYFDFGNGRIASVYLDPADGSEKSATDNLVSYSTEDGCAEILLQTAPLYLTEFLDVRALNDLAGDGIYSIWFEGTKLQKNDPDLQIRANPELPDSPYELSE
ncbi:MAG: hypothetical protein E7437_01890 [Ruminococcaceae bacterium]|nr:hypothetical protein [Oscillospiraceae bacterium]